MYTLYYAPGAASFVVHWLLIDLDLPHELRLVDTDAREQKGAAYLALNPNGVIPTLLIDGAPFYESAALQLHLADAKPDAGLAPRPGTLERTRYHQWTFNLANMVQPLLRQWWYPDEVAGAANAEAVLNHVAPRLEAQWERLDAHVAANGPWVLGERLSTVDFYLTMLMRWSRKMQRPGDSWPALAALASRMKARPSFKTLYRREGLTEWA